MHTCKINVLAHTATTGKLDSIDHSTSKSFKKKKNEEKIKKKNKQTKKNNLPTPLFL